MQFMMGDKYSTVASEDNLMTAEITPLPPNPPKTASKQLSPLDLELNSSFLVIAFLKSSLRDNVTVEFSINCLFLSFEKSKHNLFHLVLLIAIYGNLFQISY